MKLGKAALLAAGLLFLTGCYQVGWPGVAGVAEEGDNAVRYVPGVCIAPEGRHMPTGGYNCRWKLLGGFTFLTTHYPGAWDLEREVEDGIRTGALAPDGKHWTEATWKAKEARKAALEAQEARLKGSSK
jgi:hypothetical protein